MRARGENGEIKSSAVLRAGLALTVVMFVGVHRPADAAAAPPPAVHSGASANAARLRASLQKQSLPKQSSGNLRDKPHPNASNRGSAPVRQMAAPVASPLRPPGLGSGTKLIPAAPARAAAVLPAPHASFSAHAETGPRGNALGYLQLQTPVRLGATVVGRNNTRGALDGAQMRRKF